jgi:hypothetical protein
MAAKRIQVNFPDVNNLMPGTKKMFLKACLPTACHPGGNMD